MNKFILLTTLQCLTLQSLAAPSHSSGGHGGHEGGHGGGHGGGKNHGPLMAIPDLASYSKITYAKGKLLDLGEYTKGEYPEKVIKITKTYAIKVPHPYPVKIKQSIPVPYPVAHPYPVTVNKIVKVPHPVPVEIIKKVEVPVHSSHSHYSLSSNHFPQPDYSGHQDTSGGYSDNEGHSVGGNSGLHLVQYRYNENFGGGAGAGGEQQHLGSGAEGVYQQHQQQQQQQEEETHQFADYPVNIMQHANYGQQQIEVSHHGIQDGVDGYSIHTVSMNVPQQEQQQRQQEDPSGGESHSAPHAMQQTAEEQHS